MPTLFQVPSSHDKVRFVIGTLALGFLFKSWAYFPLILLRIRVKCDQLTTHVKIYFIKSTSVLDFIWLKLIG